MFIQNNKKYSKSFISSLLIFTSAQYIGKYLNKYSRAILKTTILKNSKPAQSSADNF